MDEITTILLQQIKEIEQKDEAQIIADMAGELLQDYVYEFTRFDRRLKKEIRVVKLSWVGVREVARGRDNIMLEEPSITETDDHWRIVLRGTDLTRNFSVFGGCHQPKKMTIKKVDEQSGEVIGEEVVDDPHAFSKCLSKAQRNTLEPCIPGAFALRMIDRFLVAAGKKPLRLTGSKAQVKAPGKARVEPKPQAEWDKITREQVTDYLALEKLIWDLTKKQPAEMYRELGVKSRNDMTITAWEAFLQLKELFTRTEETQEE
ncbi:MAG: hypothetical protein KKF27_21265 [Gammaproteobacteria bacterium]|nr:hypothetical protein [Gammaproteobacteria bacterium]